MTTTRTLVLLTRIALLGALGLTAQPARSDVFTVGVDGEFSLVQQALDLAAASPGKHEIRVQAGTYFENLELFEFDSAESIDLSGGWNSAFDAFTNNRDSILDGSSSGQVLRIAISGSDIFEMRGFLVQNALTDDRGAMEVDLLENSQAFFSNNTIENNVAESERSVAGGLWVTVEGTSRLVFSENIVRNNTVTSTNPIDVRGGGMEVRLSEQGSIEMNDNLIEGNVLNCPGECFGAGGGVGLLMFDDDSSASIINNHFINNQINAGDTSGLGLSIQGGNWIVHRNIFIGNTDGSETRRGEQLSAGPDTTGRISDTLIANGNARGVSIGAGSGGRLDVINLTIVNHFDRGIDASVIDTGEINIFNTISINAGINADIDASINTGNNIFADDPNLLINPAEGNFQLAESSAAIDAGDNNPPGGLSLTDLSGQQRVSGAAVDIGAFENNDPIFSDNFQE